MPNQINFRSDITTVTEPKFFASRVVKLPDEDILFQEIAGEIGYDQFDNVEIHFYEIRTNVLVFSTVIRPTDVDILKLHITSYIDGTYTTHLRIDFTKLFESRTVSLLPNTYKMVLNFFSDEIGSYDNRTLYIQEISPSRSEVQLAFINTNVEENNNELYEFISTSFNKPFAEGAAQKIFKSGVTLGDESEGVLYENIIKNIAIDTINQTYDNTIQQVIDMNMEPMLKDSINTFVVSLYESVRDQIIIRDDRRIQSEEYKRIIHDVVKQQINKLQQSVGRRIQVT